VRRSNGEQTDALGEWFAAEVPAEWFTGPPEVAYDNDEILVVGALPAAPGGPTGPEADAACIERFREATREQRVRVAARAEARFGRKVSWGARCGALAVHFTTASVPVMTRLRMTERSVLDTLIDAGVARSRSEALAWCVRLVGDNESEWIDALRDAFEQVQTVRAKGPRAGRDRRDRPSDLPG
jgi:hypothetical protein